MQLTLPGAEAADEEWAQFCDDHERLGEQPCALVVMLREAMRDECPEWAKGVGLHRLCR
jgi:hypothetical protein